MSLSNTSEGRQLGTLYNKGTELQKEEGRQLVMMQICYIISNFNNSLKVPAINKMTGPDIYECAALLMPDMFYMRLEDLILCLRMAKESKFGPAYNRVDTPTIMDFWRQYNELKSKHQEAEYYLEKGSYGQYRTEEHTKQIKAERIAEQKSMEELRREANRKKVERADFEQFADQTK